MPEKTKQKTRRFDAAIDPLYVKEAHRLYVFLRLGYGAIARKIKFRFGLRAKPEHLARTIARYAKADGGKWEKEREMAILREIALESESDELLNKALVVLNQALDKASHTEGGIDAKMLAALNSGVNQLLRHSRQRDEERRGRLVEFVGDDEFEVFMASLRKVLGDDARKVMPAVMDEYRNLKQQFGMTTSEGDGDENEAVAH